MKFIPTALLFSLLAVSNIAGAQDSTETMERPSLSASRSAMVTAVVEEIDHETRRVTLKREDGAHISFTASDDVRNLGQVDVGDVLVAEYVESLSVQVFPNDGMEPDAAAAAAVARAKEGAKPGFAAMEQSVIVTTLESVNLENNTFRLKMPDGSINEYTARVPENLRRVVVGDLVVITVTDAIAVVVEEKPTD